MSGLEGKNGYYLKKTGARVNELLERHFIVPTFTTPPTEKTLSWDDNGNIVYFRIGETVRVVTSNSCDFYRVNDIKDDIIVWVKLENFDKNNYYTQEEINNKGFLTSETVSHFLTEEDLSDYYNKQEIDDKFSNIEIPEQEGSIDEESLQDYLDLNKYIKESYVLDALTKYYTKTEINTIIAGLSGGGGSGGDISQEQLAAIMEAISKKADKATTLEGYGITNAYNKTYIDSTLNKYVLLSASHQTIKGDITIEGNLVVKGDMASQGEGNPSLVGASGVIVGATEYRDLNGDGLIDLTSLMALYTPLSSHNSLASRVSTLEGKSTSVSVSQTLTSGKEIGAITIDGVAKSLYAPSTYDWSEIANQPSITVAYGYSASNFEELKWSGRDLLLTPYRYLIADAMTGSLCMTWSIDKLESEFAKYLPLSGGTVKGSSSSILTINRTSGNPLIHFQANGTSVGFLGIDTDASPCYVDPINFGKYALIHSGNIGSQSVAYAANAGNTAAIAGRDAVLYAYYTNSNKYIAFNLPSTFTNVGQGDGYIEYYDNGGWYNCIWGKVTAQNGFVGTLTGNASSATKLQTARKLWGKSFDGTADVSGFLYHNGVAFVSPSDSYTTFGSTSRATYIDGSGIWFNASGATNMLINSSGNVTIGGSDLAGTSAKLAFIGNQRIYRSSYAVEYLDISVGDVCVYYNGCDSDGWCNHVFQSNGTTRLFINGNSGNVGIGTASPSAKLHIVGDVRIDGNLIVTGDSASGGTGVVSGGGLDETQLQSYLTANGYINASNIANYALTTAGGTIEGNLDVKTASGSTLKIFSITGSSTAMKQFVYSDASYIESGNSAYGSNMNLYIRGISGKTGNKLYLTYENIYCRGGNYINIDSGNISNYVSGASGGGAYNGIVTNALEMTGITMLIPNGVHTLYVTKTFQLNLRGVTPEDPDKSCVIFLVKKGSYTVTVNPVASSGISLRNAGLAPSSAASVGTYYGIILNWDSESSCWIGYVI